MRNLLEYPITKDEILEFLEGVMKAGYTVHSGLDMPCGSMGPTLLEAAYSIINSTDFETFDLANLTYTD